MTKRSRAVVLMVAMLAGCASRTSTTKPSPTTPSTTPAVDPVITQIRAEGLERSQVMDTLDYLTNVIGPRLTASPGQKRAADWARDQFASWGLSNSHLEPWGPFGRGWSVDRYSLQVTEPTFFVPIAYPRAWSPSFAGKQVEIVHIDAQDEEDLEQYKGKLEGKIVLVGEPRQVDARFEPLSKRLSEDDLQKLADYKPGQAPVPERQAAETASERRARFAAGSRRNERMMAGARPTTEATTEPTSSATEPTTRRRRSATSRATTGPVDPRNDPMTLRMVAFAAEEKAAVIVTGSSKGDGGTMFVQQAAIPGDAPRGSPEATTRPRVWADDAPPIPPQLTMAIEDYNRLARIAKRGITVKADIEIVATEHGKSIQPENVIAEIPGSDLADEVVMVGAHLDSWHSGTGATDNGIGSACAMEAIRILKALDLKPRRTIRVALWTGEEQGIFGSAAYVKEHFGYVPKDEPTTQSTTQPTSEPSTTPTSLPTTTRAVKRLVKMPEYEKLSVYFNLDNGTGRIRGVHAQGNTFAMPIFRQWLRPFADLDAKTVTLQDTGGTDHLSFDSVGLPGFQFIQDPIEYSSRTHHSNMDVYDRVQADDAKQASTIMAAFLWNAANLPERFPRKPFEPK